MSEAVSKYPASLSFERINAHANLQDIVSVLSDYTGLKDKSSRLHLKNSLHPFEKKFASGLVTCWN